MATLHIVRQSAFTSNYFAQCIAVLGNNDVIAFIDDGCYNMQHNLINNIEAKNKPLKIFRGFYFWTLRQCLRQLTPKPTYSTDGQR